MINKKKALCSMIFFTIFASCGSDPLEAPVSPTPVLSPIATEIPHIEATSIPIQNEIEPTATQMPVPTEDSAIFIPEPTVIPLPNDSCMYMNYSNSFPVVVTDSAEIVFGYDDLVTIIHANGAQTQLNLSSEITLDGLDVSRADCWYFCGALRVKDSIYAHYDYLNGAPAAPSFLVRIDVSAETASSCIISQNPKKHFSDSFTILENRIYYTSTSYNINNDATTDIISVDLDGNDKKTVFEGIPGKYIPFMTTDENALYFILTDSESANLLFTLNPENSASTALASVKTADFLVAVNGYLLTSTQNNVLTYYCLSDSAAHTISLTSESKLITGHPMTDGVNIYIPLISYNSSATTRLLPVDLAAGIVGEPKILSNNYYHLIGMIDQFVYAENVDEFIVFDITDENF